MGNNRDNLEQQLLWSAAELGREKKSCFYSCLGCFQSWGALPCWSVTNIGAKKQWECG